jgi:hypothetical protein
MRRIWARITFLLAIGLATTAGLAWYAGFAAGARGNWFRSDAAMSVGQRPGYLRVVWTNRAWGVRTAQCYVVVGGGWRRQPPRPPSAEGVVPWWAEASVDPQTWVLTIAQGWPLPAFTGTIRNDDMYNIDAPDTVHGLLLLDRATLLDIKTAIHCPATTARLNTLATVLALRPCPAGLAADTGAFAAAWGLLIFGPLALVRLGRRLLRARPGLCRRCGYDLTGNTTGVCPECGAAAGKGAPAPHAESTPGNGAPSP